MVWNVLEMKNVQHYLSAEIIKITLNVACVLKTPIIRRQIFAVQVGCFFLLSRPISRDKK